MREEVLHRDLRKLSSEIYVLHCTRLSWGSGGAKYEIRSSESKCYAFDNMPCSLDIRIQIRDTPETEDLVWFNGADRDSKPWDKNFTSYIANLIAMTQGQM